MLNLGDNLWREKIFRNILAVYLPANKIANPLATPTRRVEVSGPALRRAHSQNGRYLATHYLPGILDIEPFDITHVQGNVTEGYQIKDEKHTLVVALMRGDEPMALGVSEVLPKASFLHAKTPADFKPELLAKAKDADGHILIPGIYDDILPPASPGTIEFIRCARFAKPSLGSASSARIKIFR